MKILSADNENEVPQILYIEDDESYADLVCKRLTRVGFQVTLCHDSTRGRDMILNGNYHLVLLNYQLPSGRELIEALAAFPSPPLVIVFAENDVHTAVEAMRSGADDYVVKCTKDDHFELMLFTLDRVLAHRRAVEDRKKAEEAFGLQKQLLHRKDEEVIHTQSELAAREKISLSTLAAGIAHEINGPLNFIQGMSMVSSECLEELRQVLTETRDAFTPSAYEQIDELLAEMSKNVEVIYKHGEHVRRAVKPMSNLARDRS